MPLVLPKPGDAQKAGQRRAAEMSWQGKLQKKSEEHRTSPLQQYAAAPTSRRTPLPLLGNRARTQEIPHSWNSAKYSSAAARPTGFRSFLNSFSFLQ